MKWYRNLKISLKLILGFVVVAVIAAIVGTVGMFNIFEINKSDTALYENDTKGVAAAGNLGGNFERLRYNALKLATVVTKEEEQECISKIEELKAKIDDLLVEYKDIIKDGADTTLYDKICSDWENYEVFMDEVVKYVNAGEDEQAKQVIFIDSDALGGQIRDEFIELLETNSVNAAVKADENSVLARNSAIILLAIILIGVAAAILLGLYIAKIIAHPISLMVTAADKLAMGDVNAEVDIDTKDEIGKLATSFKKMIENIRNQALAAERVAAGDLTVEVPISSPEDLLGNKLAEMVKKNNEVLSSIYAASEEVAAGSEQVSDSSVHLSNGAAEQSSSIEELTASIEDISTQTQLNAENANKANELAQETQNYAKHGYEQMQEMLKAMDEISEASSNISSIIKVIDDIAFQTNILALNAAVEAARAGQHGKGFAVVAEEVRNLAARSASAAKETTEMIEGSILKTEDGTKIANETAQALDKIVGGIEQVAAFVDSIAKASDSQAVNIKQISQGINQVSEVVQSNSATSEEIAATSEELSGQAMMLKQAVSQYKLKTE